MKLARLYCLPLLSVLVLAQASTTSRRDPLSAYIGHWESSGKFYDTKFSKQHTVTSTLDCRWSPQGTDMVCEQLIRDDRGEHTQLTVYAPDPDDSNFTVYSIDAPGHKPWTGSLKIEGKVWTYGPLPEEAKTLPLFRTINIVKDGEVTYKVEFSEEAGHWTTMSEGASHRTAK